MKHSRLPIVSSMPRHPPRSRTHLDPRSSRHIPACSQNLLQPAAAFTEVTAQQPEAPQGSRQPQCRLQFALVERPAQRGAQIVVLDLQLFQGSYLLCAPDLRFQLFSPCQEVVRMPAPYTLGLPGTVQLLQRILADGLQHAE